MRKTVHLCLSSHQEVMYRSEADLIMGFNCLALAVLETESRLLAEGFMTTHNHKLVQTDDAHALEKHHRYSYSRYFNAKYSRCGRLGERTCFSLEIVGNNHILTALNYVLRQGLHHGLSSTPFGYPHCSANSFFRKELGKDHTPELMTDCNQYAYMPCHHTLPQGYRMSRSGLVLREDVIDTEYVEREYMTARTFLYMMNRLTDDSIILEQRKDNDLPPVTLDAIESGVEDFDVRKALICEQGKIDNHCLTDLELCHIIDNIYLPHFAKRGEGQSIYSISPSRRAELGNAIWEDAKNQLRPGSVPRGYSSGLFTGKRINTPQLRRCLAL